MHTKYISPDPDPPALKGEPGSGGGRGGLSGGFGGKDPFPSESTSFIWNAVK